MKPFETYHTPQELETDLNRLYEAMRIVAAGLPALYGFIARLEALRRHLPESGTPAGT